MTCRKHPGRENHCSTLRCDSCWLCLQRTEMARLIHFHQCGCDGPPGPVHLAAARALAIAGFHDPLLTPSETAL